MATTITDLGGSITRVLRLPDPADKRWSSFNPSIGWAKTPGFAILFRSSNYLIDNRTGSLQVLFGAQIMSRMWFTELDEDLNFVRLREVAFDHGSLDVRRGVEDPRLFWREDGWHFSAVMLEPGHTTRARMTEYRLNTETMMATLLGKLETPYPNRPEKNWMAPDKASQEFDYVYSFRQTYKNGVLEDIPDSSRLPKFRGGSGLIQQSDGTYLAVVHEVDISSRRQFNSSTFASEVLTVRNYTHRFVRYSFSGQVVETTDPFLFESPGIEYAAGMVEHRGDLVVSYGKQDAVSYFARIPKKKVLNMLNPVVDLLHA